MKIISNNKKARFNFELLDTFECGLVLRGTEIKSIRESSPSLQESYVNIDSKMEIWVYNIIIPHYSHGNRNNHQEDRKRKLLMHRKEIEKIKKEQSLKDCTLVPTKMYFKNGRVKLEIALAKGKKLHDKRQDQIKKSIDKKLRQKDYT
ncbi:SsrA-binding protein SmpB [Bacteriovoracaceae bacterium]|nr:SsrA-binding protein SmpB [Bacteriovoracaceae bacterium]